jgi:hypothetical protein
VLKATENAQDFYDLYAGPDYPTSPKSTAKSHQFPRNPLTHATNIDIGRIEAIHTYNAFTLQPMSKERQNIDKIDTPSALYILPSLLNHSCSPTAQWQCIGDIIVIRASKDVATGGELTLAYTPSERTYIHRNGHLSPYSFQCECWLCELDRQDGEENCVRREELISEIPSLLDRHLSASSLVPSMELHRLHIQATYSTTRGPIRPALFNIHRHIAHVTWFKGDRSQLLYCAEECMKALEVVGITVVDCGVGRTSKVNAGDLHLKSSLPIKTETLGEEPNGCIQILILLSAVRLVQNDRKSAERWLRAAIWGLSLLCYICPNRSFPCHSSFRFDKGRCFRAILRRIQKGAPSLRHDRLCKIAGVEHEMTL